VRASRRVLYLVEDCVRHISQSLVLRTRREFTVNIISEWFLEAANHTCGPFDSDVDEMALAGLTPVRSHRRGHICRVDQQQLCLQKVCSKQAMFWNALTVLSIRRLDVDCPAPARSSRHARPRFPLSAGSHRSVLAGGVREGRAAAGRRVGGPDGVQAARHLRDPQQVLPTALSSMTTADVPTTVHHDSCRQRHKLTLWAHMP